jgi:hypothetical protein
MCMSAVYALAVIVVMYTVYKLGSYILTKVSGNKVATHTI